MPTTHQSRYTKDDDYESRPTGKIATVVQKLLKHDVRDYEALADIRRQFTDEQIVNEVYVEYKRKLYDIMKKARKFKERLLLKYHIQMPVHDIIKKATKYKKKAQLTDSEFNMFVKLILTERKYTGVYDLPNTKMSKTLGFGQFLTSVGKLNIKDKEMPILKDILDMYGQTTSLHRQVILQHLAYSDCSPEALTGKFKADKHNVYSYVHPIMAAMFLPKIPVLDEHMLIANIGYIIKCKHEGRPIMTKPDAELYWDMITDPNDLACDMESPIKDIKNRYDLQTRIWDDVMNLRQGRYYNNTMNNFLAAVEKCRTSIYDAPDLTYLSDEGSILRKILSAFSLRPTIVSTSRLYGSIRDPMYGSHVAAPGVTQLTTIPMITIRLPLEISGRPISISLEEGLYRPQWYVEDGVIIPKTQRIVHSRDIIFFYVNRRYQTVNLTRLRMPFNFSSLPATVAGWESLNTQMVTYDPVMRILNDTYRLRSVVLIEHSPAKKNLIIGCSAAIISPSMSDVTGRESESAFLYNPQAAGLKFRENGSDAEYRQNTPVTWLPMNRSLNGSHESFEYMTKTRGTIFMYEKYREGDHPLIKY
uniref:Major core protein n=1 Tax=Mimivirus LCMiAC01 TaxID=2506608 RepID=A0A481Z1Z4_9VIRU|nr:MAG: major core protein [Mimivirus LCMiAC01]